jgi:hypothetical protein
MRTLRRLVGVCLLTGLTASLHAIYVRVETQQVPIARLVQNLERDLAKDPKNVGAVVALARLYGMAYALKSDQVPAVVDREGAPQRPWYGYEPDLIPYKVKPGAVTPTAAAYLQRSIEYYEQAIALDPANLLPALGHAWALEQSGAKSRAVAEYRAIVTRAWPEEQNARRGRLGGRFYTAEAAGYLIPLLDAVKDAAEIKELERRRSVLQALPRPITPIAVPLIDDAAVSSMTDPAARVRFDADGSGLRREWTWITPDAGWLVYDALDSGRITSALQWFGNVTFWLFWDHGYLALAALDDDGDGELAERELRHLAIWRDGNGNGVSDPGEVRPLAQHGIVAISCAFVAGDGRVLAAFSPHGVRMADGSTRPTYDVILRRHLPQTTRNLDVPAPFAADDVGLVRQHPTRSRHSR